jgi:hypothetical protein
MQLHPAVAGVTTSAEPTGEGPAILGGQRGTERAERVSGIRASAGLIQIFEP